MAVYLYIELIADDHKCQINIQAWLGVLMNLICFSMFYFI